MKNQQLFIFGRVKRSKKNKQIKLQFSSLFFPRRVTFKQKFKKKIAAIQNIMVLKYIPVP